MPPEAPRTATLEAWDPTVSKVMESKVQVQRNCKEKGVPGWQWRRKPASGRG